MRFCNRNLFLLYTLAVASFEPIEATISRRVQTKSEGCVAQAVAWLPEDPRNAPENFKHLTFECELDPIDAKGEIGRMLELDLTAKQEEEFKSLMANGVFIPNSSILTFNSNSDPDREEEEEFKSLMANGVFIPNSSILTFNSNSDVFGTSGDVEVFEDIIRIPPGVTISSFLRKGTRSDNRQRNRRLGDQFGDSPTLVIKTIDTSGRTVPQSIQELSNYVFGPESEDAINARNQFSACSAGKFDLSPGNFGHEDNAEASAGKFDLSPGNFGHEDNADHTPGVIEVNIDISLVGSSQSTIRSAIARAANAKLGLSLPGQYEFTLYTTENCYGSGCGWAAYAYYNNHLSMYVQSYASYPAVVLHELGHNFGLAHSGENVTYDDHSCLMGNPLFGPDLAKMCYNAAKSWQIGWYDDAKVDYKPTVIGNESWTGQLVGVAQYLHADRDGRPVTLRIDTGSTKDYFINFNRKIGMTSQNKEGSDLVNVYEQDGNGESTGNASKILKNLNEGDEWTKANFGNSGKTLSIKVNEIVLGDESIIGYADVTICLGTCNFGSPSISPSPTVAPSVSSSLRPTLISSSPTGNPTSSFSPTTDGVSSKCWRLWTHKDLTTSGGIWDVKLITFFKSSDCSEDSAIPNNGTPIDSANAGASFVPDFAFKSNHFWGGRYVNDYFYVGMSFSDSKKIQCIQMLNGGLHNVRELTVQAFDEADSAWKDVYIAKNLSQAAFGVNRMQLYSSPVVPTPSPSSSPTSSPTSPVTSSSAAPSAALTASPSAAPSAALTASPV
eukprot:CAMPEP_0194124892 /NCGR_PEP_ID=MMETSP0150-20130528/59178_1 /TAXON_ID=122233 /ORGANISM="Chaetoceros debilis, Strain MM31A-1" /LENGTH=781 /DNA_ID=CAMNT_0038818677 /DNA_START=59 /DNA_END=2400 /DNA_ORIENTATION=-